MVDVTQETSLEVHLRRISKVVKHWPGEPLDEYGSIRILNANGNKPPVFWCFNSAGEFPALANALGTDQPVVGLRSLNQILEPVSISARNQHELGKYYADKIFSKFGSRACIVGGNCQAAQISYAIALKMKSLGSKVLYLMTLDAQLRRPFPGEIRMLFGRESHLYNPFFEKSIDFKASPILEWQYANAKVQIDIINCKHGEYFLPDNVGHLAQLISAPSVSTHFQTSHGPLPTWYFLDEDDAFLTFSAPCSALESRDFAINPIWEQNDEILPTMDAEWIVFPVAVGTNFLCKIRKPESSGNYKLRLVVCWPDKGPGVWPIENNRPISVVIGHQKQGTLVKAEEKLNTICTLKTAVHKFLKFK